MEVAPALTGRDNTASVSKYGFVNRAVKATLNMFAGCSRDSFV